MMNFIADWWGWIGPLVGFGVARSPDAYRWGKGQIERVWKKLP